jgi:hypothetical protein
MLRPLFFLVMALTAGARGATPAPPQAAAAANQFQVMGLAVRGTEAPADEYFGRYRLSSLSVRNAIYDMTIEGNSPLALPLQAERIEAVRFALVDWADRYPRDPWLPSSMVKFSALLYAKHEPSYDPTALALLSYLQWGYPQTWYGRYAHGALADFEMHPNIDLLAGPGNGQLASVRENAPPIPAARRHH